MRGERGTTFDPMVLDAFVAIEPEILQIAAQFRDADEQTATDGLRPLTQPTRGDAGLTY
jgi:hypothetical protein